MIECFSNKVDRKIRQN